MMKVTEIVVSAGRTFNHPHEDYSNLKPQVTLKAALGEGDDPVAATKQLQALADGLVEDHKQGMLKSIEELHRLTEAQQRMIGLSRQLKANQDEIDRIRAEWPALNQLSLTEGA